MINTINSDLIRGNISTIILKALFEGDRYGYDIVKEIEQKSSGQYKLKQPTLYSSLKRLETQGFIRSYWGAKSSGGRRKYFTLTDMGRELFIKNQTEWEYSRTVIDRLISDKEYDLGEPQASDDDNIAGTFDDEFDEQDTSDSEDIIEDTTNNPDDYKKVFANMLDSNSLNISNSEKNLENTLEESQQTKTEATEKQRKEIPNFDVSGIIADLFDSLESQQTSYSEKIAKDIYKASDKKIYSVDTYFNDVKEEDYIDKKLTIEEKSANDDIVQSDTAFTLSPTQSEINQASAVLSEKSQQPVLADNLDKAEKKELKADNLSYTEFLSYKSEPTSFKEKDSSEKIYEPEYKSILGGLFPNFVEKTQKTEPEQTQQNYEIGVDIPLSDEMKRNNELLEKKLFPNSDNSKQKEKDSPNLQMSAKDTVLNQRLTMLAESSRSSTGDNLKTRIHDNRLDSIFKTQYHYYSNKLMLVHFAILFGVILAEIITTFLVIQVAMQINRQHDLYYYMAAVLGATVFPIVAAVYNFKEPNKLKRYELNFKDTLIFRLLVVLCCLLIIYALNVTMQMPLSFSADYLNTLILPSIMALNFPLSTVIFYFLYTSQKFNQIL